MFWTCCYEVTLAGTPQSTSYVGSHLVILVFRPVQAQSCGPEPTGLHVQVPPGRLKELEEKGRQAGRPLQESHDAICADGFDMLC